MESFEDFKKKYEFQKYEQTSCIIYEMYIRAENIEKKDLKIDTSFGHFSDVPRIKDIYLYSSNTKAVTLQNIIYNAYPEIYIDAVIWITQYHIYHQLITINNNLSKIEIQEEIINYFSNLVQKMHPNYNRLFPDDKFFEMTMIYELINYRDKIDRMEENIENKIMKKNIDFNSVKDKIDSKIYKLSDNSPSFDEYKTFINEISKDLQDSKFYKEIAEEVTYLKITTNSIDNIIGYISDLQQELNVCLNDDIGTLEIDISGLHKDIQKDLNNFSFTLVYLQNEYLNKEEKKFIPQLIENQLDGIYIRITKAYVQDLIKNHLLNLRITPIFKNPVYELNKISPLTTLHNINLSLPIEELTSYIQNLKDNYNKNLNTEEKTKYEIMHLGKIVSVEKYLKDLKTAVMILYIYDYPIPKKKKEEDEIKIWNKLEISRSTYYLLKKIGTTYIEEKKYLELYNSKENQMIPKEKKSKKKKS